MRTSTLSLKTPSVGIMLGALTINALVTLTVISSLALNALNAPSEALKRRTYVPSRPMLTLVTALFELLKVTIPGPLILLQLILKLEVGRSSSLTIPCNVPLDKRERLWSCPALTTGALLIIIGDA